MIMILYCEQAQIQGSYRSALSCPCFPILIDWGHAPLITFSA